MIYAIKMESRKKKKKKIVEWGGFYLKKELKNGEIDSESQPFGHCKEQNSKALFHKA